MSTADDEADDEADDLAEELPPDPDSVRWLFHEPAVRNHLFAAFAALAMIFVIMFATTGPVGSVPVVLLAVAGLMFRWLGTPLFVLLLVFWFQVFPAGLPPGYENRFEIEQGRFRVTDVLLVFSVVVYVVCHYRVYGFTALAIPFENSIRRKGEKPFRRPPALVRPGEIGRVLAVAGVVVIVGQLAWLAATLLETDPGEFLPLKFAERRPAYGNRPSTALSPGFNRFVLLVGMIFFTTLAARLVFGYWRLRLMGPAEAGMMLQDGGWDETRRENVRVESWKAWGRERRQQRERKARERAAGGRKGDRR